MASQADKLVLVEATSDQWHKSHTHQAPHWGKPLTSEQFFQCQSNLAGTGHAKACHLTCWVLVPEDDTTTLDFYCSCETYRRPILLVGPNSDDPEECWAYSVASVFTAPKHRSKGYASRMMVLLHSKLRKPDASEDDPATKTPDHGRDGVLSFLFSDVGDFYSRAKPPGWIITSPLEVIWNVDDLRTSPGAGTSPSANVLPITPADFTEIAKRDEELIRREVSARRSTMGSGKRAFAVLPTGDEYVWFRERCLSYIFGEQPPQVWGARIAGADGDEAFAVWTYDLSKSDKRQLIILRLRCQNPVQLGLILQEAAGAAREWRCGEIVCWNVGEDLLEGGKANEERNHSLPAVAWYTGSGQEWEWWMCEKYTWC